MLLYHCDVTLSPGEVELLIKLTRDQLEHINNPDMQLYLNDLIHSLHCSLEKVRAIRE
ncbi:MAG: hypothetical protein H2061_07865 [Burkholderiales bacterium]|nr:hypothetical protein [Burkholderiales bacterium]